MIGDYYYSYKSKRKDTRNCLNLIFGTELGLLISFYLIVFAIFGAGSIYVYELLRPYIDNVEYSKAFDHLSVVLGLIFYIVYHRTTDGYTDAAEKFRSFCFEVVSLSDYFFSISKHSHRETRDHFIEMRDNLTSLIVITFKTLSRTPIDEINGDEYLDKTIESERVKKVLNKFRKEERKDDYAGIRAIRNIMCNIYTCVKISEAHKHFTTGDVNQLNRYSLDLEDTIKWIDGNQFVSGPRVFYISNILILVIYFGFWTPYYMWVNVGPYLTAFAYPIVVMMLFGNVIFRAWLKDAFDPYRPTDSLDYKRWVKQHIDRIDEKYNDAMKHKGLSIV